MRSIVCDHSDPNKKSGCGKARRLYNFRYFGCIYPAIVLVETGIAALFTIYAFLRFVHFIFIKK